MTLDTGDEPDEMSAAIAAVCALDHFDWLAVMSALVTGGPGTPASAADLARYVRDFDPDKIIGFFSYLASSDVEDDWDLFLTRTGRTTGADTVTVRNSTKPGSKITTTSTN